ncbi:MAG: ROK family protein, partial [Rhodospirillaceae bacterium]|nr:ROK family protein [Rhodospirillaceae bacterium]
PAGDYAATLDTVALLVDALEQAMPGRASIGVGMPGAISPATGLIKNANSVWLNGKPFDRDLAAKLGRPVRVANDANCFAVSEATDGAAAGLATVFGVILGTGIGGGVAINGRALTGGNAIAGEWGHNPLPAPNDDEGPGLLCYCGRHGCIETWLSGSGLARDHETVSGERLDGAAIVARADADDKAAIATLDRYKDRLARALATVINILDPDAIVLGGGLSSVASLYTAVPRLWTRHVFSDRCTTKLLPPKHGAASGVRGAAWLWPADEATP